MEEWLRAYCKLNGLLGKDIILADNLPIVKMPTIEGLVDIYGYIYLFNKYIDLYDQFKSDMYFRVISEEVSIMEFCVFLSFFTDISTMYYDESSFIYSDDKYININNIDVFMRVIKVLHHKDRKQDYYIHSSGLVDKYMQKARDAKKKIEDEVAKIKAKSNKLDDGQSFDDIISTISARHPSLHINELVKLNYYQILDQYKRLLYIDRYSVILTGNATEEYQKKTKHYSSKLVDEG